MSAEKILVKDGKIIEIFMRIKTREEINKVTQNTENILDYKRKQIK